MRGALGTEVRRRPVCADVPPSSWLCCCARFIGTKLQTVPVYVTKSVDHISPDIIRSFSWLPERKSMPTLTTTTPAMRGSDQKIPAMTNQQSPWNQIRSGRVDMNQNNRNLPRCDATGQSIDGSLRSSQKYNEVICTFTLALLKSFHFPYNLLPHFPIGLAAFIKKSILCDMDRNQIRLGRRCPWCTRIGTHIE